MNEVDKHVTKYIQLASNNRTTKVLANSSSLCSKHSFHGTTTSIVHTKSTSREQQCRGYARTGNSMTLHKLCRNARKRYLYLQNNDMGLTLQKRGDQK